MFMLLNIFLTIPIFFYFFTSAVSSYYIDIGVCKCVWVHVRMFVCVLACSYLEVNVIFLYLLRKQNGRKTDIDVAHKTLKSEQEKKDALANIDINNIAGRSRS